jgi:phosphopantetheine--protein transferase-like protein
MIEIKKIVATFIGKNIDEIESRTIVDRSVVKGSILIHRMYATLASKGFIVNNYSTIKYFYEILDRLNEPNESKTSILKETPIIPNDANSSLLIKGIGIDIEEISLMPISEDFRSDQFYIQNFTASEISYCILKENPYASFAGLFSLKEAMFKSNNDHFKGFMFNQIEINHTLSGEPIYNGFLLSLSHTQGIVVAVSISIN